MFPLGDMLKGDVKQMAVEHDLEKFVLKPESMGICFIGSRNFQNFIIEVIPIFIFALVYILFCDYFSI